ncbi:hypothetical protein CL633_02710 [bacterium]|nr:hypothetical protein [bacterium]
MLFEICGCIPKAISHIIWDVGGVRTDKDKVDPRICELTAELESQGIYQSFITGRDAEWLINMEIQPLKELGLFKMPHAMWLPELGLVHVDYEKEDFYIEPSLANHSLLQKKIRDELKKLSHNKETVMPWATAEGYGLSYAKRLDANGKAFFVPHGGRSIEMSNYIWSEYKHASAAYEVWRDENGDFAAIGQDELLHFKSIIQAKLQELHCLHDIDIFLLQSCISLWPKGIDKAWSAYQVLQSISERTGISAEQITKKTLAFGDSASDLPFSSPKNMPEKSIVFAFVGPYVSWQAYENDSELSRANVVIKSNAVRQKKDEPKGAKVTLEIMNYLMEKNYFTPL